MGEMRTLTAASTDAASAAVHRRAPITAAVTPEELLAMRTSTRRRAPAARRVPAADYADAGRVTFELHPVDPEKNASRKRPPRLDAPPKKPTKPVSFDPPKALLDRALRNTATPESHHDQ